METPQSSHVSRRHSHWMLGLALVGVGLLLLSAASGYYIYARVVTQGLDTLVYIPEESSTDHPVVSTMTLQGLRGDGLVALIPKQPGNDPTALTSQPLYPGEWIAFNFWSEPWAAISPSTHDEELATGFLPVDQFMPGEPLGLPRATIMRIPAIGLEAEVQDLKILDLGDSREYETPNRVVGHIPGTANPGEKGNGWLFGHLQSPLRDEGSVFLNLPRIPEILRTGQRVYVVLEGPLADWLYEVYQTEVLHKDDFRLYQTGAATITLVTCVPALLYDHRLLVEARLVGAKPR